MGMNRQMQYGGVGEITRGNTIADAGKVARSIRGGGGKKIQ